MKHIISVILIGKSFLLKAGLESFLSEFDYVTVVNTFTGSEPALSKKIVNQKPDIVIFHIDEPAENLAPVLRTISKDPSITLIALTSKPLPYHIQGKFSKIVGIDEDKMTLTEELGNVLNEKGIRNEPEDNDHKLSGREIEILKHVASGLTNQEIADTLFLSVHTVTTHRKNITKKLGIKSVSGLTVYALMNKLISPLDIEP